MGPVRMLGQVFGLEESRGAFHEVRIQGQVRLIRTALHDDRWPWRSSHLPYRRFT
jgi:hypothetical protein